MGWGGGGGGNLYVLFLISNILPQLEQSSFNYQHRHQVSDHLLHQQLLQLLLLLNQHPGNKKKRRRRKRLGHSAFQPTTVIFATILVHFWLYLKRFEIKTTLLSFQWTFVKFNIPFSSISMEIWRFRGDCTMNHHIVASKLTTLPWRIFFFRC